MRFNRVVNPSTGWRDSLFQEHRVGPPGGCVEGSVFFRVCVAAAASRLSVGAETETLEDDEDGEDDDDDQRDAESLRDVFFWEAGEGLVLLSQRKTRVDTGTVFTVPAGSLSLRPEAEWSASVISQVDE